MEATKKTIRLQRIVIAALLAELIPLLVLVAVVTGYAYLVSPEGGYEAFTTRISKIINPLVGSLATFGMAYWASRKPEQGKILHGFLTGLVVIFIEIAIMATPGSDFGVSEGLGMLAKLGAGTLGGYMELQHYLKQSSAQKPGHRLF